ncbi:MAG: MarR family transcriptional regulator [Anaerolineales bacterium]|nr:MAG: MarR family transcriptional regulator [Anaerolineales bacterium]
MNAGNNMQLTRELFQILKQFSSLKWEQNSGQELKRSECELLAILYMNLGVDTEAITASELSSQLQITPAGVTHLINPLEEAGYIMRLQDPNDRRLVLIGLTEKGNEFAGTLIAEAHKRLVGLVEYMGEEDSRTLIRLMSSTIAFLETPSAS